MGWNELRSQIKFLARIIKDEEKSGATYATIDVRLIPLWTRVRSPPK